MCVRVCPTPIRFDRKKMPIVKQKKKKREQLKLTQLHQKAVTLIPLPFPSSKNCLPSSNKKTFQDKLYRVESKCHLARFFFKKVPRDFFFLPLPSLSFLFVSELTSALLCGILTILHVFYLCTEKYPCIYSPLLPSFLPSSLLVAVVSRSPCA